MKGTSIGHQGDINGTSRGHQWDMKGTSIGHEGDINWTRRGHQLDTKGTSIGHEGDINWTRSLAAQNEDNAPLFDDTDNNYRRPYMDMPRDMHRTPSIPTCNTSETILNMFSALFRTPEEQAEFENQRTKSSRINLAPRIKKCMDRCYAYPYQWWSFDGLDQTLDENFGQPTENQRNAAIQDSGNRSSDNNVQYHGCCSSVPLSISPDTAKNQQGRVVRLVTIANRRQYFSTESCSQAKGCTTCECMQEPTFVTAVVYNSSPASIFNISIDLIQVPGCCKCMNVGVNNSFLLSP
ncbi:hypothetical protein Btru_047776 [Bulinus truncatus]|nr:hypothetical protein Btru_047776 [Bulinus truncatus]